MQLSRLPISILVGLELVAGSASCVGACLDMAPETESSTDTQGTDTMTTGPCLDFPAPTTSAGPTTSTSTSTSTTTGPDTTTGPCLDFPPATTGTDTDTDTDTDTGTTGAVADDEGPDTPPSRVIERVLSRAQLPDDVIARLRARLLGDD